MTQKPTKKKKKKKFYFRDPKDQKSLPKKREMETKRETLKPPIQTKTNRKIKEPK
jgi:hypothetical protein